MTTITEELVEATVFDGARPTRQGDLVTETAGMVPVPEDGRYGANWRNFTVWFAPNMELSGVFTGTLAVTLGLGFWPGLTAIIAGVIVGTVPVAILALWGPQTGMAQLPLARLPFGKTITIVAAVQWLSAVAWEALGGLFGGEGAQSLFHVPFWIGVVIVLALQGIIGFLGYEFLHRLEAYGAALLTILFALLTWKIIEHGHIPWHNTVHGSTAVAMWVLMFTIAISGSFSWATYAADYSRYMPADTPRKPLFWYTFAGLALSYIWVYTIGLAGAATLSNQTAAGVQSLMGGGALGYLALIAIVFGSIAGNTMNDYSGSLAVQAGGVKIKRPYSSAAATVIAFFLILWIHGGDTAGKFENVLLFTAYWIAPFLAIVLIDWQYRKNTINRETLVHMLDLKNLKSGWPALVALVVGFGAMVPFMDTSLVVGPASTAMDGADISFFVGFIVAAVVYYPMRRLAAQPVMREGKEISVADASTASPVAVPAPTPAHSVTAGAVAPRLATSSGTAPGRQRRGTLG